MNTLYIESSIFADNGVSSQLANELISQLEANGGVNLTKRSFASDPIKHLDGELIGAIMTDSAERSDEQAAIVAEADAYIKEVQDADTIILGVPMYNFSVPSQLKAWFDHIARAGVTFQYTENGPKGLLSNKKVYVLATRGGFYKDTPMDSQTPFVTTFMNFLGLDDVEFIYAEGLNVNEESKEKALTSAKQQIQQAVATHSQAA
ncbi:MAG: NAD(P)H-dependent oxidoreductase [Kangiellaceae bacterium]|jgi:FMN-dependent NADH-azoreductase|nr:NAD(P)H-dependent oxidoreductase [Kangiellaceae bacterium]